MYFDLCNACGNRSASVYPAFKGIELLLNRFEIFTEENLNKWHLISPQCCEWADWKFGRPSLFLPHVQISHGPGRQILPVHSADPVSTQSLSSLWHNFNIHKVSILHLVVINDAHGISLIMLYKWHRLSKKDYVLKATDVHCEVVSWDGSGPFHHCGHLDSLSTVTQGQDFVHHTLNV